MPLENEENLEEENEVEEENSIDYTDTLQTIIDNQELIIDNQNALISNQELMLISLNDTLDEVEKSYNQLGVGASVLVAIMILILLIGACRYIKKIF